MTPPAGGVVIKSFDRTPTFERQLKKLSPELRESVLEALKALLVRDRPAWIRFEKLSGYRNPCLYTIHATKNHSHKISFEIKGDTAILRRIGTHKEIDREPA